MDDQDCKDQLPIYMIHRASEIAMIKTTTKSRLGKIGEPIVEYTHFGWTIMSPGNEVDLSNIYLTTSTSHDYEQLCSQDVFGVEDANPDDKLSVYADFKEQLYKSNEGWYETGLLWKSGHPPLENNKSGSLGRLKNLVNA